MAGNLLRYMRSLGLRGVFSIGWDKLVTDRKRYRPGATRSNPAFSYSDACAPLPPAGDRPRSILYLIHCFYPERRGGTERFVLSQAKETLRRGGAVRVLTLSFGAPEGAVPFGTNLLWKDYTYEGVPATVFCYKRLPPGTFYKRIEENDGDLEAFFSFLCGREHFDVVHAAYAQPYAAVLRLCREQGLPYVVTATDFVLCCHAATMALPGGGICTGSEQGEKCRRVCKNRIIPDPAERYGAAARLIWGAKHVTAPSAYAAAVIESEFPGVRVRVVPHGIAPGFSPGPPRARVKRFVYAGSLSPLKGVDLLIRAFRELPEDVSLDIYGGSVPDLRRLKKLADQRVRFLGAVNPKQMPEVFRAADCAVVPSLWPETYNFSLREALSCGCLVVAARLGALPEAVTEGKNGFLFPAGDTAALRDALLRAAAFDMTAYKQLPLPSCSYEADQYERIYADASSD